jgi:hypothetical protein
MWSGPLTAHAFSFPLTFLFFRVPSLASAELLDLSSCSLATLGMKRSGGVPVFSGGRVGVLVKLGTALASAPGGPEENSGAPKHPHIFTRHLLPRGPAAPLFLQSLRHPIGILLPNRRLDLLDSILRVRMGAEEFRRPVSLRALFQNLHQLDHRSGVVA